MINGPFNIILQLSPSLISYNIKASDQESVILQLLWGGTYEMLAMLAMQFTLKLVRSLFAP